MGGAGGDRLRVPGRWFRLRVLAPREGEDDLVGLLQLAGAVGAEARPAGPNRVELRAWFSGREDAERAAAAVGAAAGARVRGGPEAIEDPGWLEASLGPREPLRAGRFVIVAEPASARGAADGIPLVIPPSRAFGTGEHPTTRMCLELLGDVLRPGAAVLDLGTGSGILAVAAALAGASSVFALDADESVLDVAAENLGANGVAPRVRLARGSWGAVPREAAFDVALANIHRSGVIRAAGRIARALRGGGRAIVSGFLATDVEAVARAWERAGCARLELRREAEWAALLVGAPR
ncbi:MAG: 50S ribosomal protein L11 methyltransferase [Acidobacteria bacterium]|nr:50S ribosomal protein L11 methyltransferase [Acidobacteriota bacterium]